MKPSYIKSVEERGTFCAGCNARIFWAITNAGKKMPLDAVTLEPHWGTCPAAKSFRSKRNG
jgi:hypothetical protein